MREVLRYQKDKNGRRQRGDNRAFNCVLNCPSFWPRSRVKGTTNGHEGESLPGGDKVITETLDFEPHWWLSPLPWCLVDSPTCTSYQPLCYFFLPLIAGRAPRSKNGSRFSPSRTGPRAYRSALLSLCVHFLAEPE